MKLGEDGKLVNEADVRAAINKDWGEFKQTVTQQGAKVENPPKTGKATMTVDEIMAIQDTGERQKAIFENKDKVELLAKTLLERETMDGRDVAKLVGIELAEETHETQEVEQAK